MIGTNPIPGSVCFSTGLDAAIRSFEELSLQLAGAEGARLSSLLQRFEQAQDALDRLSYFDADARAEQLIAGINLGGVTLDRLVSTLSGGQKTKLTLARLLFHYNGTIIAVTHDTEFVRHLRPDTLLLMPVNHILKPEQTDHWAGR